VEHQEWVLRLGTELRENGVDVILDKWDLREGNDANAFMEKMVVDRDIRKVILVVDEQYSQRANQRRGGVGTETQIISAEVYESVDQNKFVAVIAARDEEGKAKLPVFYKSRIYIDLSDEDLYSTNFEQLLRWVYDKPLNVKPEVGKKPAFLDEEGAVATGTSVAFRRVLEALKNSKAHSVGSLIEYFDLLSANFGRFRLAPSNGAPDFDDKVLGSIEGFLPTRSELVEVFSAIAQYENSGVTGPVIHKFFESLIPYLDRPLGVNSFHKWDFDNFKFVIHEGFLLCLAIFIKYERYDLAVYLITSRYFESVDDEHGQSKMQSYGVFRNQLASISHRNTRLALRRLSLHADLLKERCSDSGVSFAHLMQADFVLYVSDAISSIKYGHAQTWWPETLIFKTFRGGAFEIFLRAESTAYFNRIAPMLGLAFRSDLGTFIEALKARSIYVPKWDFDSVNPLELMNYDNLSSRV
jgi:hypothetical protein